MKLRNLRFLGLVLLIVGLGFVGVVSPRLASASPDCTVTIGPGSSIQAAIDAASPGDVICLKAGTWEENIEITKDLTLQGAGMWKTKIKGTANPGYPAIRVKSDSEIEVTISGLQVSDTKVHSSDSMCAAKAEGSCPNGIEVQGNAKLTLSGCKIVGLYGIEIRDKAQAKISDSIIEDCRWYGVKVMGSAQAKIIHNRIERNALGGISLRDSSQANIYGLNEISLNGVEGIKIADSAQATIAYNTITENSYFGVILYQRPCSNTTHRFEGAVRGSGNTIRKNAWRQLCPDDLRFLMTGEGGCYGPLCE